MTLGDLPNKTIIKSGTPIKKPIPSWPPAFANFCVTLLFQQTLGDLRNKLYSNKIHLISVTKQSWGTQKCRRTMTKHAENKQHTKYIYGPHLFAKVQKHIFNSATRLRRHFYEPWGRPNSAAALTSRLYRRLLAATQQTRLPAGVRHLRIRGAVRSWGWRRSGQTVEGVQLWCCNGQFLTCPTSERDFCCVSVCR